MMKKVHIESPEKYMKLLQAKRGEFLYQDHPNDGIDFFNDKELEEIGWHASIFSFLSYRDISHFIEENCEGTLTYNDHPMGFNGFVEVDDIKDVREKVTQFIKEKIKNNIHEEYDIEHDESLNFFGISLD